MHKVKHKDSVDALINKVIYINLLVLLSIASARKHKDKHETNNVGVARFGPIIDPSTIEYIDLEQVNEYFNYFNMFYGVKYTGSGHIRRVKERFIDNVKRILVMNKFAVGVQFRINEFANLSLLNFTRKHTGFNNTGIHYDDDMVEVERDHSKKYPRMLDFRTLGLSDYVKHQGPCKSSYVFSAVANVAAQFARSFGYVPRLSEQQAFNCEPNGTCKTGGLPHIVLQALQEAGGIVADTATPYNRYEPEVHKTGCEVNPTYAIVSVTKVIRLRAANEHSLVAALDIYGPVITAIYVSESVKHYHAGVLDPSDCNMPPNHNVLLVGYGVAEDRRPYWILMNSWGKMWGEQGFLRLVRGKLACGIGTYLATCTVEKYMPSVPATRMADAVKLNNTQMSTDAETVFKNRALITVSTKSSDSTSDSSSTEDKTTTKKAKIVKKIKKKRVKHKVSKDKPSSVLPADSTSTEDNTTTDKVKVRAEILDKTTTITTTASSEKDEPQKKEEKNPEPRNTAILEVYTPFVESSETKSSSKAKKNTLTSKNKDDDTFHSPIHRAYTEESSDELSDELDKSYESVPEPEEVFPAVDVGVFTEPEPEIRVTKGIWDFTTLNV